MSKRKRDEVYWVMEVVSEDGRGMHVQRFTAAQGYDGSTDAREVCLEAARLLDEGAREVAVRRPSEKERFV